MSVETIPLPAGNWMPILGFGTWQATDDKELEEALDIAFESGYRHIDTAPVYENEKIIGKQIKKWLDSGKIKRSELFIVSKLPPTGNRAEGVEKWIKKSLDDLQIDYLDLYLIHTPFTFQEIGDDLHPVNESNEILFDSKTDHVKVWLEMEKQVKLGRTKSIGLSNFNQAQIERILKIAKLPVSNLQIELHTYFQQKELTQFCNEHKIPVTAYSPLGTRGLVRMMQKTDEIPDLLENPVILQLAGKYDKTPAQIVLRHTVQKGIAAIPKSTNKKRIKENIQLFDWELNEEDMKKLNSLDVGESARVCDFSFFKGLRRHPEFPF